MEKQFTSVHRFLIRTTDRSHNT